MHPTIIKRASVYIMATLFWFLMLHVTVFWRDPRPCYTTTITPWCGHAGYELDEASGMCRKWEAVWEPGSATDTTQHGRRHMLEELKPVEYTTRETNYTTEHYLWLALLMIPWAVVVYPFWLDHCIGDRDAQCNAGVMSLLTAAFAMLMLSCCLLSPC